MRAHLTTDSDSNRPKPLKIAAVNLNNITSLTPCRQKKKERGGNKKKAQDTTHSTTASDKCDV